MKKAWSDDQASLKKVGGFGQKSVNPISYQRFMCFSSTYFLVGAQVTLRPQCCVIF